MRIACLVGVGFTSMCCCCSVGIKPPQDEYVLLGTIDLAKQEQRHSFVFECPSHELIQLLFRLRAEKADVGIEHIRSTWESNYSVTVRISDASGSLVHSNRYDSSNGNISTGGNWMEPDVSIILGRAEDWAFLAAEQEYDVEVVLTGAGLAEHSLDFLARRIF